MRISDWSSDVCSSDLVYDQLLAGSALAIAETVNVIDKKLEADLPYAALDMLSLAPDDRVFYRIAAPGGETITGYSDLPAPEAIEVTRSEEHTSELQSLMRISYAVFCLKKKNNNKNNKLNNTIKST